MGDRFKTRRRDPAKLAWTKGQPCLLCDHPDHECWGPIEAHHIGQERHDDEVVPVCVRLHREIDSILGKRGVLRHYGLTTSWKEMARDYERRYQAGEGDLGWGIE